MRIEYPTDIFTYPDVPLPEVWTVVQKFNTPSLSEQQVEVDVRQAMKLLAQDPRLHPGATVAVGVGSRGLDNLVSVVRTVVSELRAREMKPFIIPAMGSHGGATPEGQTEVLHGYGITPENVGAEIRATMEVDLVGTLRGAEAGPFDGHEMWCDRNARAADAILLINRIKPHTDFRNDLESGIAKMSVIGLGKRHGADGIHRHGAFGLKELIPRAARFQLAHLPLVGGVALIENEFGRTAEIHGLPCDGVAAEAEMALLRRARAISPRLPFDELDILIIDEMGKNISGASMDTHVIGRGNMPSIPEHDWGGPNIRLVAVLDLTPETHGNAAALGSADLTTERLIGKIDFTATFINQRTSGEGGVLRTRLPLIMPTAEDCVRTAIATCGRGRSLDVRLARVRNTADTQYVEISGALVDEARRNTALTVSDRPHPIDLVNPVRPA